MKNYTKYFKSLSSKTTFLLVCLILISFLSTMSFSIQCSYNQQNYLIGNDTYYCPNIYFALPTEYQNINIFDRLYFHINISSIYGSFNITNTSIYVYNYTDLINITTTYNNNNTYLNFTVSNYDDYYFNATTYDVNGSYINIETRTIHFYNMSIVFNNNTQQSNQTLNTKKNIFVNVSSYSVLPIKNLTINLFNRTDWYNRTTQLNTPISSSWHTAYSNFDGSIIYSGGNEKIYVSNNSGINWSARTDISTITSGGWVQLTSPTKNLSKIYGIGGHLQNQINGRYFYSLDGGNTFNDTSINSVMAYYQIATNSLNGNYVTIATCSNEFLYVASSYLKVSNDSGITFTDVVNSTNRCWIEINMSDDGKVQCAVSDIKNTPSGTIPKTSVYSLDYGISWNTITNTTPSDYLRSCNNGTRPHYKDMRTPYNYNLFYPRENVSNSYSFFQVNTTNINKFSDEIIYYRQNYTSDSDFVIDFTSLKNGLYFFNSVVCNIFNACISTPTRNVTINYTSNFSVSTYYPSNNEINVISPVQFIVLLNGSIDNIVNIELRKQNTITSNTNIFSCYQESPNVVNQSNIDGNCELNYTGSVTPSNPFLTKSYDGNFSSCVNLISSNIDLKYVKPPLATSINWIINTTQGNFSQSIPYDCFNANNSIQKLYVSQGSSPPFNMDFYCYNTTTNTKYLFSISSIPELCEEAILWNITNTSNITTIGDLIQNITNINAIDDPYIVYSNLIDISYSPFCWYAKGFNGSIYYTTPNVCFYTSGDCSNNIKDGTETDKDYGGICGRCGNYTFYSDDTAFQILDQANLINRSKTFNQSLCDTGNANLGMITFFMILIVIGLFIFGFLIIFLLIPFVIFVITGKYRVFLWNYFTKQIK